MTHAPRTVLVTGANTGIGLVTARTLAVRGDRVLLACRSPERGQAALDEVHAASGRRDAELVALDLGDLRAVQQSATALLERGEEIDVLVANAGLAGQRGRTTQGFELAFGTNHLGHFLFVTALLPLLRGSETDPARVVVVASDAHLQAKGIDWERVQSGTRTITGLREYGVSKLANVLFAQELARQTGPELFVGALHPGVIASDVWRAVPWPIRPLMTKAMRTTEQGAETSLLLAADDAVLAHRGAYWSVGELKEPSEVTTAALGAELWERSEAWVGPWRTGSPEGRVGVEP